MRGIFSGQSLCSFFVARFSIGGWGYGLATDREGIRRVRVLDLLRDGYMTKCLRHSQDSTSRPLQPATSNMSTTARSPTRRLRTTCKFLRLWRAPIIHNHADLPIMRSSKVGQHILSDLLKHGRTQAWAPPKSTLDTLKAKHRILLSKLSERREQSNQ